MPEKKMPKKSQLYSKQKEPVSKMGGRRVSTKMTRVKHVFFVMCIRNQFVHTNVDFGYLEESKMRMPRLEICRDRRDRRSCKIFVSCVNFSRKQRSFFLFCKFTHT